MKQFLFFLSLILLVTAGQAQMNIGSNQAPQSSAMLQISGNTKGFLPPRMSRDSMYLIANPATGLLVFNTTDSLIFMRRDTGWVGLTAGGQLWANNGSSIYNANSGFVGIGTNNPSTLLHVEGANPLTLLGVADGTNTSTDSILTITNGLVRKLPLSSFALTSDGISSATAPLTYSGGIISIDQASTTDDGYLSASDYNIFNNKVSSISINLNTLYAASSFALNQGAATGTLVLNSQLKNKVFAGPTTGANAQPTFRSLVAADMPIATTTATTGLGAISVGSGLSVTGTGVLSVTNPSNGGSVTAVSVASANGLAGTVANSTTTPAITLTTSVTGMVKGNGTALSAATSGTDYAPGTAANSTGIVKSTTGTGALTTATTSDFPTLNQNTTGNAATVTTNANLTGDVTSVGNASTIATGVVTNAKLATMATQTFKGRTTAGTGSPEDLTATQATAMLNTFTSTLKGLVPASSGGTTGFLRADGTFAVPPGTNTNAGTVTAVSVTSANGVSGTVATSTTTPAISLTLGDITPSSVAATGMVTGSNLSGTNTGDETNATIKTKLGAATATNDGYLTATDWITFNNKASTTNTWSTTGNAGTSSATNFLGTTDNVSLRFQTNNTQRMILDSLGNVAMGTDVFDATNPEKFLINAGTTSSVNALVSKGTINNYFQMNIKNLSSGNNATSDIVATADNGTESTNYVDLGINGSGYTGSAIETGVANDGYLISAGKDFYMVNSSANKSMLFLTGGTGVANERMRILANGRVGMGVQDPTAPFVVKDTMEIRRVGSLSQLLFTNTAGTGDFRIGGDGGDLFWQGGGGRGLQMGSYWTTILTGDRQTSTYPAFISSPANTGVLVLSQRDASVPLGIQANSGSQSANLTEWRNSSGTVLSAVTKDGNFGIGLSNPSTKLHIVGTNPLTLIGVQTGANTDSILTIINGTVKKLSPSALTVSSSNAWSLTGNTNTLASNYFLGTTNSDPLIFKVNSNQAGRLDGVNTFLGYLSGNSNGTTATQSTGIGYHALYSNTTGTYNTAIGYGALPNNSTGSNNIGIGNNANVANNSSNSIAMGTNSVVNYSNAIAVGTGAQANNTGAVGIGNNTYVNGLYGIAIGSGPNSPITQASGNYTVALGYNSYAGGVNAISIGTGTTSNGTNSVAIGNTASSGSNANATAIGNAAAVTGTNSTAIGYNAAVASDNTIILGDKSNTSLSVGIGSEGFSNGNREKLLVDAGTTSSFNVISGKGNINNYLQLNIQNKNAGTAASSDLVATSDNGDETNNYVDLGINSSVNSANYFGGANDAYLYTLGQNMLIGTAAASKVIAFLTGGGTQSTNERMRIDGSGKVGIGNIAPTEKLDITGNLRFSGAIMPNNAAGSIGQILTSTGSNSAPVWATFSTNAPLSLNSGVIAISQANSTTNGYLSSTDWNTFNNKASTTNSWAITGNAGTTSGSNFFGTTDNTSLKFRTNNTQTMLLDSLGNVAIGSSPTFSASPNAEKLLVDAGTTNSFNVISGKGNINNYLQLNIQNKNAGSNASSDVVATADNGDESNNYVDLGINSSGNSTNNFGAANDAYLYAQSQNMLIGTASANKSIVFLTGGGTQSTNERMRIDGSGNVGIGTNAPASNLTVYQSSGTGSSKGITLTGNSIGGTSSGTGFLLSLGYNQASNKQLWLGDADYAGNNAGTFIRFEGGGTGLPTLDAISGNNTTRRYIALGIGGDGNSGVTLGNDGSTTNPSSFVWDNGNMAIGNGYRSNAAPSNGLLVQGNVGIGTTSPTAVLQLKAGTASANTAPLKLTSGTNLGTPEDGAVEYDGTNYFATQGTTRYTLAKTLTNTASLSFNSTAANTSSNATSTITVNGANSGDVVILGVPSANGAAAGTYSAYVSSSNTVTVKFTNNTTGAFTPATGTFRVTVIRY